MNRLRENSYVLRHGRHARPAPRRRLELELSPDQSLVLADVLEAALHLAMTVADNVDLDLGEPDDAELAQLAMEGGLVLRSASRRVVKWPVRR